jgi:hypothetical protein
MFQIKELTVVVNDSGAKEGSYFVHYANWNKRWVFHQASHRSWDEWVPESRLLKYNDANLQRQKDIAAQRYEIVCNGLPCTSKGKPISSKKRKGEGDFLLRYLTSRARDKEEARQGIWC